MAHTHPQVSANGKGFIRGLGWWFALAIPSTYTNSMVGVLWLDDDHG